MTILDDLAAYAAAQRAGTSDLPPLELPLCAISKFPVAWCGGCRAGHHTPRVRPEAVARSLMAGVDEARAPDFCPRCTPLYGTCRCDPAASE